MDFYLFQYFELLFVGGILWTVSSGSFYFHFSMVRFEITGKFFKCTLPVFFHVNKIHLG